MASTFLIFDDGRTVAHWALGDNHYFAKSHWTIEAAKHYVATGNYVAARKMMEVSHGPHQG